MENSKPSNPRMQEFDGVYAADTYRNQQKEVDYFSLRDYFASKALNGILSTDYKVLVSGFLGNGDYLVYDELAKVSYSIADAMLKQRETE